MNELVAISALIGDRSYRIKINPADEEVVRKTLKTINDKIVEFKTLFAGKDMQDYIAMVLVWYASQQSEANANNIELTGLNEELNSLEKLLDKTLSVS